MSERLDSLVRARGGKPVTLPGMASHFAVCEPPTSLWGGKCSSH